MTAEEGIFSGRSNSRFSARIPSLSSSDSSEADRVQDSALLRKLGITQLSYNSSKTLDSIAFIIFEEAVVLICLIIPCT